MTMQHNEIQGVDVVEWSRALDVRLIEWCCSVSMVWVQIPTREEQKVDSCKKSNSNTVWFQTYISLCCIYHCVVYNIEFVGFCFVLVFFVFVLCFVLVLFCFCLFACSFVCFNFFWFFSWGGGKLNYDSW